MECQQGFFVAQMVIINMNPKLMTLAIPRAMSCHTKEHESRQLPLLQARVFGNSTK